MRQEQVALAIERSHSQRRACELMRISRTVLGYRPTGPVRTIDVAGSIRSNRVIEVLARLVSARGAPRYMRSDNGPEFVSHAILKWIEDSNIQTALNDPGKPWQNGTDESFNGRLRDVGQVKARFSRVHRLRNRPAVSAPRVAGSHDRNVPSP